MTIYEQITEIRNNTILTPDNYQEAYTKAELELVNLVAQKAIGLEVNHQRYGTGKIVESRKTGTLECLVININFTSGSIPVGIVQFSLAPILNRIVDNTEITEIWNAARLVHNELTDTYNKLETARLQAEHEAAEKAEEEAKAEAKYQAAKAKALKDFETLTKAGTNTRATNELYYSLGWLAKNVGTISAALPDYLLSGFERHFGSDVKPTVVDSRKKTISGYSMQWALSMKASILKKAKESIPSCLTKYLNSAGNALTNTAFVWDLVDTFGFSFGKEQNIEKIKAAVPTDYLSSFEAGLLVGNIG